MDTNSQKLRDETRMAKAQAERLLADLLSCRASGDLDCHDLYKQVTGHSSLEKAIDETKRVIASHDRLLAQIEKECAEPLPMIAARVGPRVSRQAMAGR
ncbi:MAG: hypothetical protein U0637_06430 [Phycisphaerales bacterium]